MKIKQTTLLFILLISVFSFPLLAQKSNYSELITKKANLIEQKVIAWRHDFHQNPELGNREFRT
ncbi:MAG: amidohydrolase, partial [Chitinophagaceae bacterium]|nr:amidohydrolase [Chitinophagaceae bacterium]